MESIVYSRMDPAVLILSFGSLPPKEIAENILSELNQSKLLTTTSYDSTVINGFKCDIKTKYYSTSISLIPYDGKFDSVPTEIKKATEALIIYFEPTDRSFIKCLSEINDFINVNEIQIGFLVTKSFTDEANELTIDELKDHTNVVFDIVSLEDDEKSEGAKKLNYAEVIEGLQNCVWSNVNTRANRGDSNNTDELENQLNDFENLLITAQNLRNDPNLSRDEMLNKAEQFAKIMSAMLNDDDDDSD